MISEVSAVSCIGGVDGKFSFVEHAVAPSYTVGHSLTQR